MHYHIVILTMEAIILMLLIRGGEVGGKGAPIFYNLSTGIGFLPYKLVLLSLCGPQT